MLTTTTMAALLAILANVRTDPRTGYAVDGDRPTSRPLIPARERLARFLHAFAGGRCVVCGCTTRYEAERTADDRAVIMHIVPCGPNRKGFLPGNVANGCRACNVADEGRDLRPYVSRFAHWEGIPTEWPPLNTKIAAEVPDAITRAAIRASLGIDY